VQSARDDPLLAPTTSNRSTIPWDPKTITSFNIGDIGEEEAKRKKKTSELLEDNGGI